MPESAIGYYDLLNISKDATLDEIKKAFRELAHQFHPDKNKGDKESEEKFKEISKAYEVLKDPQSRMMYDMTGNADVSGFSGWNAFAGGFKGFGGMGRGCGRGRGCGKRFRNNFYGQFFTENKSFHEIKISEKEAKNGAVIAFKTENGETDGYYKIKLPENTGNGALLKYTDYENGREIFIKVIFK